MLLGLLFRKNIKLYEDSELVQLIQKDNADALGVIFERYSHLVIGLCIKYLKDKMKAEDMMMRIFESLPSKVKKGEIQNFKSWLYSVSRNECLMELRKKKKEDGDIDNSLLYAEDESASELKMAMLKEEEYQHLESAIEELKKEQKECINLFYLKRKSYDEVASLTGFDLKKVKSYIQNGKRNLKLILENKSGFRA